MAKAQVKMSGPDVTLEFDRRHRAVKRWLVFALAAWGAVVASIMAVSAGVLPQWAPLPPAALGLLLLVPYSRAGSRYRCPACGTQPRSGDGEPGALLNPPKTCQGCGVRLR